MKAAPLLLKFRAGGADANHDLAAVKYKLIACESHITSNNTFINNTTSRAVDYGNNYMV